MNKSFGVKSNLSKAKSFIGLLVTLVASVSPFSAVLGNYQRAAVGFGSLGVLSGVGVLVTYALTALAFNLQFARVSKLGPLKAHGRLALVNYFFVGASLMAAGAVVISLIAFAVVCYNHW